MDGPLSPCAEGARVGQVDVACRVPGAACGLRLDAERVFVSVFAFFESAWDEPRKLRYNPVVLVVEGGLSWWRWS